ncbi:uncharacterized protein LOC100863346 isoform X2 [Apis florea]|uniref:uncharacterized protein LOC100863346 isoform X2 n=1 Tax=Apis florea TaxID=7463 RepID=UPI0012FEDE59|nr:uncharacterized protein LOC100863346 isoform X2 [Apis florea]
MTLFQTILILLVFTVLAVVSSQDYNQLFAGFGPYIRQAVAMRDPRSNRGPVLFPPGPPPNNEDTSGVIVGASGYGFVPPNQASSSISEIAEGRQAGVSLNGASVRIEWHTSRGI